VTLRTPAAIAGVACVPASFLAVRPFAGRAAGLAVAALCAASPVLVSFSLNARTYPFAVLFACLSLWAAGEAIERRSARRLAAWAAFAALCLWTHYFSAFLIAAETGVLLWRLPGLRRRVLAAGAAAGAAFLPLLPLFADQNDERASHIGSLSLGDRVEQSVRQFVAGPNPPSALLEGAALAVAAAGLVAGAVLAARAWGQIPGGAVLLAVLAAVTVGAPLALAVTGIDDHYFMRNLLVAWACLAGVAAVGLLRARAVPLAAALALGVAIVFGVQSDWRNQNSDWRGALRAIDPDGVPVVVLPGFDAPVANVYLRRAIVDGPVETRTAWVVVEPGRENRRELREIGGYPRNPPPGFAAVETRRHRGFVMTRYEAPAPRPLDPAALGPDVLDQRAKVLPPR
jgi:4-amino-4-deoxy-L-arabinose transferase-like glycosyltransferase